MRAFTSTELSRMQTAQEEGMMDTCELLIRTERASDEYGMPVVQWVTQGPIACGLDDTASPEMLNAEAHAFDAQLRLPIDTVIEAVDRVRITHRFGAMLAEPVEYELLGDALRGPSGLVVKLRSTELESQ